MYRRSIALTAIVSLACLFGLSDAVAQPVCGALDQRPCNFWERIPSCDANLVERDGRCIRTSCGGLGQRACMVIGRNSCDQGLVEVNDTCFRRGDCGGADQRACLIGERQGNSCNEGLFERNGVCYQCGAEGQRACAILGRKTCDKGLVEANDTCFRRGDCGAWRQRACLLGERDRSCNKGLIEQFGMCVRLGPVPEPKTSPVFVFAQTDPPAPVLLPGQLVAIVAGAYDARTKTSIVAEKIEIFQSTYFGPGSRVPEWAQSCSATSECRLQLPSNASIPTVAYQARVTTGAGVFESSVRLTDISFVGMPVRMNVGAESTGPGTIAEVPHNRAVDVVYFASEGYDLQTPGGAKTFSDRLDVELKTLVGVRQRLRTGIADHMSAVNFYISLAAATVKAGGLFGMCEHSTAGPVPWGDAQGILHTGLTCRDWSVPGPFYSAETPEISRHELHHAAFGLSDEYCQGTIHFQRPKFPNVYDGEANCRRLSSNSDTCRRLAEPEGCEGAACTCKPVLDFWRSDPGSRDVMVDNTEEQADDRRAIDAKFDECRAGRC